MLRGAYDACFAAFMGLVEKDMVPDALIRFGIRYLLSQRVREVCVYPHHSIVAHHLRNVGVHGRPLHRSSEGYMPRSGWAGMHM